jgi:hypothetical protein
VNQNDNKLIHTRRIGFPKPVGLAEMERSGEAIVEARSYDGPLPVIRLAKRTRLDRIIKVAKR